MNSRLQKLPSKQSWRSIWLEPRFWLWSALIISIILCAALPVVHWRIQHSLQGTINAGEQLRLARVHLNKGFLHVTLDDANGSPYSHEQGLALIRQAAGEFQYSVAKLRQHEGTQTDIRSFLQSYAEFTEKLDKWKRTKTRDPRLEVELRAAFYALESETDKVDLLTQKNLRILTARYDDGFRFSLLIAGLTLLIIFNIIFFAESARDRTASELQHANRSLRMLTDCNQIMVRCETEEEMLQEICRIIVEEGSYQSAWISFPLHDEEKSVSIVAQVGTLPGQLESLKITWADKPLGQGPTGKALRNGTPDVVVDISVAPQFSAWGHKAEAFGKASVCALPIKLGEKTIAAITIISPMTKAFPASEIGFLQELADNLARSLSSLRNRMARTNAEAKLLVFRSLIDHTLDAIFVRDAVSGRLTDVNDTACLERGYSREELLGLDSDAIDSSLFGGVSWNMRVAAIRSSGSLVFNSVHLRKNGTRFPVEVSATYLELDAQAYVIGIVRDITERKRVEEENERLAAIVQSSDDAIVGKDLNGKVTSWNKGAEKVFGYTTKEMVGESIQKLFPQDKLQEEEMIQKKFSDGQSVDHFETTRIRKDGKLIEVSLTVSPVWNKEGKIIGASKVARDITAFKAHARDKEQLEQQLHQSQKMEAIGQLSGGIAHDFNNLLGAILGSAEMAKLDLDRSHTSWESLDEIVKASLRAKQLVQQILAFSRRQKTERKKLLLRPLMEETLKLIKATVPPNVVLSLSIPNAPIYALADATQVQQVLLNLINNAWHAMEGNPGKIEISIEKVDWDKSLAAKNPDLKSGQYACIQVKDNGKGMNSSTLERIFDPFFTTKAQGQGTGLGLSVVHGIVKAHNGSIQVASQPGAGSEFIIYLPAPEISQEEDLKEHVQIHKGQGQHLLYLDDEKSLTWLAKRSLERLGYKVSVFNDPDSALATFKEAPGNFDAIITDYNMPGMSGIEFAQKAIAIRPDMLMVMTSGYITPELNEKALDVGIVKLLYKPSTIEAFSESLNQLFIAKSEQ